MARIVVIGEGMLELRRAGNLWRKGYGGDTLNTAIHLARAGTEFRGHEFRGQQEFRGQYTWGNFGDSILN